MWYKLIQLADWFGELRDRLMVVRDFNRAAQYAFISGVAQTLLKAKVTLGERKYRHEFSNLYSGFRIKALAGNPMSREQLRDVADVVLDNEQLVRKLIVLGWDTLEVHDNAGVKGLKFELKKFGKFGGFLQNSN